MVDAVTHHDAHYITCHLPLAQGLQYQAIYLDLRARTDQLHGLETPFTASVMTRGPDYTALAG
jgi:hypothetical protein